MLALSSFVKPSFSLAGSQSATTALGRSSLSSSTTATTTTGAITTSSGAPAGPTNHGVAVGDKVIYQLTSDWTASTDFFKNFNFITTWDTTHGYVDYIDRPTAFSEGLISYNNNQILMKVDNHLKVPGQNRGRKSVRIDSKKVFNGGLIIADIEHMPVGCGTWPAYWMFGPNWPAGGEMDIMEGIHNMTENSITAHTAHGCNLEGAPITEKGNRTMLNCGDGPEGCMTKVASPNSYGNGFNANGGGVFATLWDTTAGFKTWFFPRNAIPRDIVGKSPDPTSWGLPDAHLPFGQDFCPKTFFHDMIISFDITLCGDWAGKLWPTTPGCSDLAIVCNAWVQDNPLAFSEAYWLLNYLRIYTIFDDLWGPCGKPEC